MNSILDYLLVEPPQVTTQEVADVASLHFGLEGQLHPLGGERDRNYLLRTPDADYTIKIANPVESDAVLEMQCGALHHLAQYSPDLPTPRIVKTNSEADWAEFTSSTGQRLRARTVTFLPGQAIDQASSEKGLLFNIGQLVAKMNLALRGYMHASARHPLVWDTQQFDKLDSLVRHIDDPTEKQLIEKTLDTFRLNTKPQLPTCRSQIIHNDVSFHNTAINPDDPTEITGIFDFGDMVYGTLIQDISIPAAEIPAGSNDPLSGSATIIAGFHSLLPLEEQEIALLPDMVAARLAMCLLIDAWSSTEVPWTDDRDLLDGWHQHCVDMLKSIHEAPALAFENLIRSTCGLSYKSSPAEKPDNATDIAWQQRQRYLGNANYHAYDQPIHVVRGQGVWLYDTEGGRFLDAYNNVPHAGHCHPRITQAISRQTAQLNTNTRYLYDVAAEYAEAITATLPEDLDTCYFVSSGSEANDLAWRLAACWTGNSGGLVTNNAYHGITEITYALSPAEYGIGSGRYPNIAGFAAPDDYRGAQQHVQQSSGEQHAARVGSAIDQLASRDLNPAALFLDSVMSSDGIFVPPPGYLETAYDLVRSAGGLCIADEVQSGFGRMGKHMWGFQFCDVTPDIVTFGKPIAGGYPMGLVVTRGEIARAFEAQEDFFSTTGGNPVACAAALEMLRVIEEEGLLSNARRAGDELMAGLRRLGKRYPLVGDIRGSGLFIGVEMVKDPDTLEPAPSEAGRIVNALRHHGILIGKDGVYGNVLKIRPPMVFQNQHVELFLRKMESVLEEI